MTYTIDNRPLMYRIVEFLYSVFGCATGGDDDDATNEGALDALLDIEMEDDSEPEPIQQDAPDLTDTLEATSY